MATRIQWSATERAAIAQRIREIRARDPGLSHPKALLSEAQMVLPMQRRRKITDSAVFALKGWVAGILREPVQESTSRPDPIPDPIPERASRADTIGELVLALVREIVREVVLEMREGRELGEGEGGHYLDEGTHGGERRLGRENARLRECMQEEQPRTGRQRLSVAVLGIQPAQANTVREAYRGRSVDFHFYDSDEAARRCAVPRDMVVLMTKFVSHKVQERWRSVGAGLTYCNGGVTELCAEINSALGVRGY